MLQVQGHIHRSYYTALRKKEGIRIHIEHKEGSYHHIENVRRSEGKIRSVYSISYFEQRLQAFLLLSGRYQLPLAYQKLFLFVNFSFPRTTIREYVVKARQ
jgi:hypothetical protein